MLISTGFHIPSLEAAKVSKGTFGRETLAAVKLFQAAHKLPSTGFVGPLTRGILNGGTSPILTTTITTPGATGGLALTLQATPANGTSLSKGTENDIATYKIQAGNSDMRLTSLALDFNNRLWLYADSITILDGSTVIARKDNLNANDFAELTVGTSYRLTLPVSGYVVPRSATRYLTIHIHALAISDRSTGTVSLTQLQTRAVDGTGVVDTQTLVSTRTFSYTGINNGFVVVTADPQSPPNMLAPISTAATTDNIVMGVADFNSQMKDSIMRSLTIYMNANFDLSSTAITTLLGDVKLQAGDKVYSADSIGGVADFIAGVGVPVTFSNMDISLPKDTLVPVAILMKVNTDTGHALDGKAASSTIVASGSAGATDNNPVIEDSSNTTVAINYAPLLSSDISFSASNSSVDYTAPVTAQLGSPAIVSGTTTSFPMTFAFSVSAGDNPLYISADPYTALSTSTTGLSTASNAGLPIGGMSASPSTLPGDSNTSSLTGYYIIPSGFTRKFTFAGSIKNTGGTSGLKTFSITAVKYGTSTTALTANTLVYYNYAALKVTPSF